MKRTAEIVLTVIGIVFYLLVAAIGGLLTTLKSNEEFAEGFAVEMQTVDETINTAELIDMIGAGGIALLIISLVCVAFGILAAIMFKKNAYPKAIGIMMIILAVVCSLISFGFCILPGVFYVIAGIVALVKKTAKNNSNMTTINGV